MPEPDAGTTPQAVILERLASLDKRLGRIEERLDEKYLPREVYQADQRSLAEWKQAVATDLVNVEAEQTRLRRDVRDGQRWAVAISVSAAGVFVAVATLIVNAAGLGA